MARLGRTKRCRLRRMNENEGIDRRLDYDDSVVELRKWMKSQKWRNETRLKLANFPSTGRGVYSTNSFQIHEELIRIPFELMISLIVVEKSVLKEILSDCEIKLSIHELLALFLQSEENLSLKENSAWYSYIRSLPSEVYVPWFCSETEINCLPSELRTAVNECQVNIKEVWKRVATLKSRFARVGRVLTRASYLRAYVLVNTRAVYVNPSEINGLSNECLKHVLSDEPSMALCPFLDMFNHSCRTSTGANLQQTAEGLCYSLTTETQYRNYQQLFISYGQHDNKMLFSQYGFVEPDNVYDVIEFTYREVVSILGSSNVDGRQHKFLRRRCLDQKLSAGVSGYSFNLAAVLFVLSHKDEPDWSERVFSQDFSEKQLRSMNSLGNVLLHQKLKECASLIERLSSSREVGVCFRQLISSYMEIRSGLVKHVIDNVLKR